MPTVDRAGARGLLVRLRTYEWEWTEAELPALARHLGWERVAGNDGAVLYSDTALGLTGSEVKVLRDGAAVDSIVVRVVGLNVGRAAAHDAFVTVVRAGTELFGEPTNRIQDDDPRVDWRDERTTLSVMRIGETAAVSLMPNHRRDFWDTEFDVSGDFDGD